MAPRKRSSQRAAAEAWKGFWHSPEGRIAIGLLFKEYGAFDTPEPGADLSRAWGQRDVLARISQLINLKPETAPDHESEALDPLERLMRSNV